MELKPKKNCDDHALPSSRCRYVSDHGVSIPARVTLCHFKSWCLLTRGCLNLSQLAVSL